MWDEGGSRGSNWRKRRGPRTLSAKEMDKAQEEKKKIKFIIGLFARADVKAHTPAFFLGCARELYMETTTRIQGRN